MTEAELARLYEFIEGGYRKPSALGRLRKGVSKRIRSLLSAPQRGAAVDPARAVDPLGAVYRPEPVDTFVPVTSCRNVTLFGFGPQAFDAWQATARQLASEPATPVEETVLARFAAKFQPRTAAELLFSSPRADVPESSPLWRIDTADVRFFWPWSPEVRPWPANAPADLRLPSHGPLGGKVLELEVWRLKRLVASVKEGGYRPLPQDAIRGTLLILGDQFRFIIRAGFHRVAVLAALGHDEVPVRLASGAQRLMSLDQLRTWPLVREGVFSPELADLLVDRLFAEDGSEMAERLGFGAGKDGA